jgi:hypothetical protein
VTFSTKETKSMLRIAATTFDIWPQAGVGGSSVLVRPVSKILSFCKSSVFLLEEDSKLIVILTSHFMLDYHCVSILLRDGIAKALQIPRDQVFCFSSHNHCSARVNAKDYYNFERPEPETLNPEEELSPEGLELLKRSTEAAVQLRSRLEPVEVRFGKGRERRITYNRKGRRADGSTYLMREEDRLLLGGDFCGDIDDDAFVVGFFKGDGKPAGFLTQFTGHPATAFHCDYPIFWAEFAQVACDDLSAAYGGTPVGFLQGCAGEINSKGLLSDLTTEQSVARSEGYGHQLGETFLEIAGTLTPSKTRALSWSWRPVVLPFREVPPVGELKARLEGVQAFLRRCEQGDEPGTRRCDGLNFPRNMRLPSRVTLIEPTRKWLEWTLALHRERRLHEAPTGITLSIAAIRISDVGIVGLPCEPFVGIGRQIKGHSPLPVTLPCGYMNEGQDSWAYIPDGPNCEDLDYQSSFYRYTTTMLAYRQPAGDLLASAGVHMLRELSAQ